ncbi:uncharacterized protein [Henckelia pumila]|uniref:uncharacterized protein n=1 Tax=Henckelia pumila TaxID=405737 RepID=UPI003C6E2A37
MAIMQTTPTNLVQVQQPKEKQPYNPYSNPYNPGLNTHPNLSWKPADPNSNTSKPVEKKASFEEIMMKYVAGTETRLQNQEAMLQRLETQMDQITTQLSTRPAGSLPSNTKKNPRDVNSIMVVTRAQMAEPGNSDEEKKKERMQTSESKEDTHVAENFLAIGKKKEDALAQMPSYTKFLKDLLKNKKNLNDISQVIMNEECSAMLHHRWTPKFQDPGSFSTPFHIGNSSFENVLCDLRASINLMSYTLSKKLGICNIEPANISLKFVDGSIKYPRGVMENALVTIEKFIYPIDFIILDIDENCEVPLILGRPFLSMSRALIDVEKGKLVQRMNAEQVVFRMLKSAINIPKFKSCSTINLLDVVRDFVDKNMQAERYESINPLHNFYGSEARGSRRNDHTLFKRVDEPT